MAPTEREPEPGAWFEHAEEDLAAAATLLDAGHWGLAAFHAQQCAEKALKAVQIHRHRTFDRVHDLSRLSRALKADRDIQEHCAALSGFYTVSRYPDAGGSVTAEDARVATDKAKEVLRWARTQVR